MAGLKSNLSICGGLERAKEVGGDADQGEGDGGFDDGACA